MRTADGDAAILRAGVASIWLLTGALVTHPLYRAKGALYLDRLGLPAALMFVTCAGEVALGVVILCASMTRWLAALQLAAIVTFTAIVAIQEPMMLVHPFGILTKNVPLAAAIVALAMVDAEGWSLRAERVLRGGVAAIWISEGLLPKILFSQAMEREVVARTGLVPMDPGHFLIVMGLLEVAAGVLTFVLEGPALRALLVGETGALVLLPVLVSMHESQLWVDPFGPLTKNLPILAATLVLLRRAQPSRSAPALWSQRSG
jgi:uncharacterized membrane protein YphA (DoxX/SURF4 family)